MHSPPAGLSHDYYQILEIPPDASPDAVQQAYGRLAGVYHPSNKITGNPAKYQAVTHAYEILADPLARKKYDMARQPVPAPREAPVTFDGETFVAALAEERIRRQAILSVLYHRRRLRPRAGGVSIREIEAMLSIPSEELQFVVWYLKHRGLVVSDDKSNLEITVEGIDFLERDVPAAPHIMRLFKSAALHPPGT